MSIDFKVYIAYIFCYMLKEKSYNRCRVVVSGFVILSVLLVLALSSFGMYHHSTTHHLHGHKHSKNDAPRSANHLHINEQQHNHNEYVDLLEWSIEPVQKVKSISRLSLNLLASIENRALVFPKIKVQSTFLLFRCCSIIFNHPSLIKNNSPPSNHNLS